MKRVSVLIDAGASLEYNAPSIWEATQRVRRSVITIPFMKGVRGDRA